MRTSMMRCLAVALGALFVMAAPAVAQETLQPRPKGEPIFLHWLNPKIPGDRVILEYWSKVKAHKASPAEMLDLGTMLYKHGFSRDAVRIYHRTGKAYPTLAEPWFLAGLVEHEGNHLKAARRNYKRCLKILTGNGWCNFYMGLVDEQLGHPFDAMHFYDQAFRFDPDLANPKVNPEVLKSKLQLGAFVRRLNQEQFASNMPMKYYEPHRLHVFKSGRTASARRRRALETPYGVVHKPKRLRRPKKGVARPARTERRGRTRAVTAHPHAAATPGKAASAGMKPPARAKECKPRFTVKTASPKPTPTLNPNRMPWGTAWRPPKKTPKVVPPKGTPKAGPPHTGPKTTAPKK